MTSKENNDATIKFFEENNFFGYPKEAINFFTQDELPMVSLDGKILLEKNGKVKKAANRSWRNITINGKKWNT